MGLLEGKTALITGAARGIGKAIALKFAAEGANIAFTDLEVNLETEKEIAALGVKAKSYASNAADFAQTEEVVKAVKDEFGAIDILVNNAGITKDGYMMLMSGDNWGKVIEVNLTGAFNVTKQFLTHFIGNRSGKIINMTSVGGIAGMAGQTNYSASKAGLIGFTKSLSKEVAGKNINVNAIAPGYILTEMLDTIPDKMKEKIIKDIPASRIGDVDDIANAAMFLASDFSGYTNGQVLVVDGGLTA